MSAPSAPIILNPPLARNAALEFYWYPPASSGDSAISSYTLACANPSVGPFSYPAGTVQSRVTGLTNGTFYEFSIYATNTNGNSGPSERFISFSPGSSEPNPPISTIATVVGTNSALVTWSPPSVLPDSPINWYVIKSSSSSGSDPVLEATADGVLQRSYLLTGLNSNSGYQFSVQAVNCPGYSSAVFTSSIAFQVVPDFLWAQNFNGGTSNFVNYDTNRLVTNTITGTGFSYRSFNQNNLYIPTSFTATNTVSFCASVYMSNYGSNAGANYPGIIMSRDFGAPGASGLQVIERGSQVGYQWRDTFWFVQTGINLTLNTWTHLVLTITSSNARFYVNGTLQYTNTATHDTATFTRMFGGADNTGVENRTFPGFIDNLRFYTRTLSASEIQSIYQNTLIV